MQKNQKREGYFSIIRSGLKSKYSTFLLLLTFVCLIIFSSWVPLNPVSAAPKYQETIMGYNAAAGGGEWSNRNLGTSWAEGEWVPYQVILKNVQGTYPNLIGMPNINISYDFTTQGCRFIDLVRGIQVGTTILDNTQAWPASDGNALPIITTEQLQNAQNTLGEYTWAEFKSLNLSAEQINRNVSSGIGGPTDAVRTITITPQNLIDKGLEKANTIVIYFQLHQSRTFIWNNTLESKYNVSPADLWGGYIYGDPIFSTDKRLGAGYVPISSGRVQLQISSKHTAPIPVPIAPSGTVSGVKWLDGNNNGIKDSSEPTLSGWRVYASGEVEGIKVSTSTLTDTNGYYNIPSLTPRTSWRISEAEQRENPAENGYLQTYPYFGRLTVGGATAVLQSVLGKNPWGWDITLSDGNPVQAGLDFGNIRSGDLEVTNLIDLSNAKGTPTIPEFAITITGPSYSTGNTKTFNSNTGMTQTWNNLIPGNYTITEANPGSEWIVKTPETVAVTAGNKATTTIKNTYNEVLLTQFVWFSDLHVGDPSWQPGQIGAAFQQMEAVPNTDFIIGTGDIVHNAYQSEVDEYNNKYASLITKPLYSMQGNHDQTGGYFTKHIAFEVNGVKFIYFHADYVGITGYPDYLNTGDVSASELAWLETELQTGGSKHKILLSHWPIANTLRNPITPEHGQTIILNLAQQYGAKLYLNGHNHNASVSVAQQGVLTDVDGGAVVGGTNGRYMVGRVYGDRIVIDVYHSVSPFDYIKSIEILL